MAMLKSLKRKWIKTLRSGKYRQGQGELCSLDGKRFCCLGVFADIQGATWQETEDSTEDGTRYIKRLIPIPKGKSKPQKSQGYELLESQLRDGLSKNAQDTLASMNDDGESFKKIADWIEANVLAK